MREISRSQVTGVVTMSCASASAHIPIMTMHAKWTCRFTLDRPRLFFRTVSFREIVDEHWYILVLDTGALRNHRVHEHSPILFAQVLVLNKIEVMASGARRLQEHLSSRIRARCLSVRGFCASGSEVFDEIIDQDRNILLLDRGAVGNHRRDQAFPTVLVEMQFHNTIEAVTGRASILEDFLSRAFR